MTAITFKIKENDLVEFTPQETFYRYQFFRQQYYSSYHLHKILFFVFIYIEKWAIPVGIAHSLY